MRLTDFIRQHVEDISLAWEGFARTLGPAAVGMGTLELRDHCPELLAALVADIESPQTAGAAMAKSHGHSSKVRRAGWVAARIHAELRHGAGFSIVQLVAEYRALRASIIRLWRAETSQMTSADMIDMERLHESIDEALAESIGSYANLVDDARETFLAILGHDLRTPLNAIALTADSVRLGKVGDLGAATETIRHSAEVIDDMATELLDFVTTRLARSLPVQYVIVDLGKICETAAKLCESALPNLRLLLEITGETTALGDAGRLGQLVRNLISNAAQHGTPGAPISVLVSGADHRVQIVVENDGPEIPHAVLQTLFDPLARLRAPQYNSSQRHGGLGLGLFIVREIATAHRGTVECVSSAGKTQVRVELPRGPPGL